MNKGNLIGYIQRHTRIGIASRTSGFRYLIYTAVLGYTCFQFIIKMLIASKDLALVFFGADVTKVTMPIVLSISGTSHISPFFLYSLQGGFAERFGLEAFTSALQLLTGLPMIQTIFIITALTVLAPMGFSYFLALRLTKDWRISIVSVLLYASIILPPSASSIMFYSLVFLPFLLYLVIIYLDGGISILLLLLVSVFGFTLHPFQIVTLFLLAALGLFETLFGKQTPREKLRYLNLTLLFPLAVLLCFPFFYFITYPEVYMVKGQALVNSPFDLYINAAGTFWNASPLIFPLFKALISCLFAVYVFCFFFRKRLPLNKYIWPFRQWPISTIRVLALLLLTPLFVATLMSHFDLSQILAGYGEMTTRSIFYALTMVFFIGVFSILAFRKRIFVFLIYIPLALLLIRPITELIGPSFLLQFQMDRGYAYALVGATISAAVVLVKMGDSKVELVSSIGSHYEPNLHRLMLVVLGVILLITSTISIGAVRNYYEGPTKPDKDFLDVSEYLQQRISPGDRVYSDYTYYRSSIFPGMTLYDDADIRQSVSGYDFWRSILDKNVTYLIVYNPAVYPVDILNNPSASKIFSKGETTLLSIDKELLRQYVASLPFTLPIESPCNESFDELYGLEAVSVFRGADILVAVDKEDKCEGNASLLLIWSSVEEGPGSAAVKKSIVPTDVSGWHFRFSVLIPNDYFYNLGSFFLELRDNQGERGIRAEMWSWDVTKLYVIGGLRWNTWYSFDVTQGEKGSATSWEQGEGDLHNISQITIGGTTRQALQDTGLKIDGFTRISNYFKLTMKLSDSSNTPLLEAEVLVFDKERRLVSSVVTSSDGVAEVYLPAYEAYSFNVVYHGKEYKDIYSTILKENAREEVQINTE